MRLNQHLEKLLQHFEFQHRHLSEYGITEEEYDDYTGHYLNVLEELKAEKPDLGQDDSDTPEERQKKIDEVKQYVEELRK